MSMVTSKILQLEFICQGKVSSVLWDCGLVEVDIALPLPTRPRGLATAIRFMWKLMSTGTTELA